MRARLLGIDLGSSACKAAAFTLDGEVAALVRVRYAPSGRADRHARQQADAWWEAAKAAVCGVAEQTDMANVLAIGLTGQIGTHVLLDAELRPLGPAVTWRDGRARREQAEVLARIGAERLELLLGLRLPTGPAWPLGRLLWLSRHRPRAFAQARAVVQPKDYVALQLCGELVSDASSWRGAVHPDGTPATAAFRELGLPDSLLPPLALPTATAGALRDAVARELRLPPGVPVTVGLNDLNSSLLGSGVTGIGDGFDVAGTSEHVGAVLPGPVRQAQLVSLPYGIGLPLAGELAYGVSSNGGAAAEWLTQLGAAGSANGNGYAQLERAVRETSPGTEGLLFLPYLAGERAPVWDSAASGAWVGLQHAHTGAHLVRAGLEGVALNLRQILELVTAEAGRPPRAIRMSGGPSRSDAWNRIKADVLQLPLEVMAVPEAGVLGAALLAGVAMGAHADVGSAITAMTHVATHVEPDVRLEPLYDEVYAAFAGLYDALRPTTTLLESLRTKGVAP